MRFTFFSQHFSSVFLASLVVGAVFQSLAQWLNPSILLFIMAVVFLNFIKVDFQKLRSETRHIVLHSYLTLITLFVVPAALFFLSKAVLWLLAGDMAIAFSVLLLFGSPTAVLAPTLALLVKADMERTLLNFVATSCLVPFSLPLLFAIFGGRDLAIDPWAMFKTLAIVVLIPFFAALLTRLFFKRVHRALLPHTGDMSVALLALAVIGAMAGLQPILFNQSRDVAVILAVWLVCFAAAFGLGWFLSPLKQKSHRLSVGIMMTWTNISLALGLANSHFKSAPIVVTAVVLSEIPWNGFLTPLKWAAKRL